MRIRQIALVAKDRDPVVRGLCDALGIEVAFVDPGVATFGLCNAVMPVGDTFLEVVSPAREGSSAERHLERHGGDSGYMVIVQTRDLDADRARMDQIGARIVWEHAEDHTRTIHLHPRDVGGAILSLDESTPWESWDWAGPDWHDFRRTEPVRGIGGVWLRAKDPGAMAARWGEVLDLTPQDGRDDSLCLALEDSGIHFSNAGSGEPDGIVGLEFIAADPALALEHARRSGAPIRDNALQLCGTAIHFVDAWTP